MSNFPSVRSNTMFLLNALKILIRQYPHQGLGSPLESLKWYKWCLGRGFGKHGEKACKVAKSTLIVGNDFALCSFNTLQVDVKEA